MSETLVLSLICGALLSAFIGVLLGGLIAFTNIRDDCETFQKFKFNDRVYICQIESGAEQ